jgi:16S rRNA (cytosine1402-N4)-methyltransferase
MQHIPVLLSEVLAVLAPRKGETVIDLTLGLGGHAGAFLQHIGKKGILIGIDADEKNLDVAGSRLKVEGSKNVTLIHENFHNLHNLHNLPQCDILFADLGLCSPHIDDPTRGFSFRGDSPLDLRFDQSHGKTASDLLMYEAEEKLTEIFRQYGELDHSKSFAHAICEKRSNYPFTKTPDLVTLAEDVYKWKAKQVLPQIFQALRIAVNDEMGALKNLLEYGPSLLNNGGRIGIISYHSREDRMVKQRFRDLATAPKDPSTGANLMPASYELLTKKAIQPTLEEVEKNSRSRSARFRAIRKN